MNNFNQTLGSLSGGGASGGNIAMGSGNLTVGNATSTTYSGAISGTGGLTKLGAGTLTLAGINGYSGSTTVSGGILQANNGAGLPSGSFLQLNGGILQNAASSNVVFSRSLGTTGGTFDWSLSGGGFSASTLPGGSMTVTIGGGSGTALGWGSAPADVGNKIVGTLKLSSSTAADKTTFNNNISLNGAVRMVQVDNNPNSTADSAVLAGVLSNGTGTGGLEKTGDGLLSLTNINTYTGPTLIDSGTLSLSLFGQISTSSPIVNNANFQIADGFTPHTVGSITGTGTTYVSGTGTLIATSIVQDTLVIGGAPPQSSDVITPQYSAVSIVPEPGAWLLLAMGAFCLGAIRWLRRGR
jgi:autotransporter-associated beta strand protein